MSEEKSTTLQGLSFAEILPLAWSDNLARARGPIENPLPGQRST